METPRELKIRPLKNSDKRSVFAIHERCEAAANLRARLTSSQFKFWVEQPTVKAFSATIKGRMVGFARAVEQKTAGVATLFVHLTVDPEFRRRGIGSSLFAHLSSLAASNYLGAIETGLYDGDVDFSKFLQSRDFRRVSHELIMELDGKRSPIRAARIPGGYRFQEYRPKQDAQHLAKLFNEAAEGLSLLSPITVKQLENFELSARFQPEFVTLLFDYDERPAGFARGVMDVTEQVGSIEMLVVNRKMRGQGLGGRLLGQLLYLFRVSGAQIIQTRVEGENERALQMYEKAGFQLANRQTRLRMYL
jgi:mycothiol synthase